MRRRLLTLLTALLMVAGIGVVAADSASAVVGSCGAGYVQIDRYNIPDQRTGATIGRVYLYWSNTARRNCVMTEKLVEVGIWSTTVTAAVRLTNVGLPGDWSGWDSGPYRYYAGPAYSPISSGHCIDVYGQIQSQARNGDSYVWSGLVWITGTHCG